MFTDFNTLGLIPEKKLYEEALGMCRAMGYEFSGDHFLIENYKFHKQGDPNWVTIDYKTLVTMYAGYQLAHNQIKEFQSFIKTQTNLV